MRGYLSLWMSGADARRLLTFGFLLTACSSFGQTFFIGLFGAPIRDAFALTDRAYGAIYSIATVCSGATILLVGHWVDRYPLSRVTTGVLIGLVIAGVLMGWSPHVAVLALALFCLRFTGQGLLGHVAITTTAREFVRDRGKALAVVALGFAAGEAVLPALVAALLVVPAAEGVDAPDLGTVEWRHLWFGIAGVVAVVVIPAARWLLRDHRDDVLDDLAPDAPAPDPDAPRSWTRGAVLRDPRFYLLLPTVLGPAFIVTGCFFHQGRLIEQKAWTTELFAAAFVAFAAAQVPSSALTGPIVDRFTARRVIAFVLLPLAVGLLITGLVELEFAAFALMAFFGLTSGAIGTVVNALWVEFYGPRHLGAIRALATALMVFSTGGSPFLFGALLEAGVTMERIALGCVAWCLVGAVLAVIATWRRPTERE